MAGHLARWWIQKGDGAVCQLCPRECLIGEKQRGFCGVRRVENGQLMTDLWECTSGMCVDPIEKKPFYHVRPGQLALSFGALGCNLACSFCQNWSLSRSHDLNRLQSCKASEIGDVARKHCCEVVALTYNEPIISAEWCIEVAAACSKAGIKTLAITNGYIGNVARSEFFEGMDGANVDLKGFSEDFYQRHCSGRLAPVLETLAFLAASRTWLEVTTLLIPGENDSGPMLLRQCQWMMDQLGPDVPLHFSAFHPDYKLLNKSVTALETLCRAREIAMKAGLRYVYIGNRREAAGSTTFCPHCGAALIGREGFSLVYNHLVQGKCDKCNAEIPGVW